MEAHAALDRFWAEFDDRVARDGEAAARDALDELVAHLPAGESAFERAGVRDSTGLTAEAVPLYREALAAGLDPYRHRRAVIQLASSLRALGRPDEAVALLEPELAVRGELDDAVRAFLALAYADTGRALDGVALALTALADHLPRYQRSVRNYARLLTHPEEITP
ncbi:tetratricopeptide repeat protein [Actinomycetospora termitidis]|uniref:Tetratricopeptide repeat protein n=1 Tax=Actinomycetospora termitidis TaxID=3053470 RepID=A0ABT7M3P0_9PSEU|nr:tetratricopeptide repeat protein [Actinomycetospora sp. Odt1-22]MDL5155036.1 tetratricopeptide repeat protein [Actinomycetospora sp. Odt1-22]